MAFKKWCTEGRGMESKSVPSETTFGKAPHARFRERTRTNKGWVYKGLAVNPQANVEEDEEEETKGLFD